MSMMECGHCHKPQDARSMRDCDGCGRMICSECSNDADYCPGDDDYDEH